MPTNTLPEYLIRENKKLIGTRCYGARGRVSLKKAEIREFQRPAAAKPQANRCPQGGIEVEIEIRGREATSCSCRCEGWSTTIGWRANWGSCFMNSASTSP